MKEENKELHRPLIQSSGTRSPASDGAIHKEIQGLRAIAIASVLIFHLWSKYFLFGYLGVDMFFVISGYLMHMLMSKRRQLNRETVQDFYFRRLKRILPEYLFVIVVVLLISTQRISPIDYGQIISEAIPSLCFFSNWPAIHEHGYFDVNSRLFFFTHTWSLSTELQFYALVPVIFYLLNSLKHRPYLQLLSIPVASFVSFHFQQNSIGDQKHMSLSGRMWQFFFGFIANFLRSKIEMSYPLSQNNRIVKLINFVYTNFILYLIVHILIYGLFLDDQHNRLVICLLTVLIILAPKNTNYLLSMEFVQLLGNISYALYLVHWPIYVGHRYYDMDAYKDWREIDTATGCCLIVISICVAYFIEKSFSHVRSFLSNWRYLITFIFLLYFVSMNLLEWLHEKNMPIDSKFKPTEEWLVEARQELEQIWSERYNPRNYTLEEVTRLNANLVRGSFNLYACRNKTRQMPTKWPLRMGDLAPHVTSTCYEQGNGTKNIVIVGNSHATHIFTGVRYHFRDLYKTLSLFERDSCFPVNEFQQPHMPRNYRRECFKYVNSILPSLRRWKHPIDILIVFFAFVDTYDLYDQPKLNISEHQRILQRFYSTLSNLTREVLFIQEKTPVFPLTPIRHVLSKLQNNKPYRDIAEWIDRMNYRVPILDHQMSNINCPKCVKFDWVKTWCADKTCRPIDYRTGLVYFSDGHHVSPLGSMWQGAEMRYAYDQFMQIKS